MDNKVEVYDATPLPEMARKPNEVLAEAKVAAEALVREVKRAKLSRKFGGEKEHLFFEAWQMIGKFYGITPKVISTNYVEFGNAQGFQCHAVAVNRDGMEISAAESMCLSDEPNWKSKPLFQLMSMAQTRAQAKVLRNVLAWVAVLAGYEATPAEEMDGAKKGKKAPEEPKRKATPATPETRSKLDEELSVICMVEDGIDLTKKKEILKEISEFDDKYIEDIFAERSPQGQLISENWVNACIGRLREYVKKHPEVIPKETSVSDRG